MILLLGGNGYVGSAFRELFERLAVPYRNVSRSHIDYSQLTILKKLIGETLPSFLINAAGYTGKPNVDACEQHKAECMMGNAVLPGIIGQACESADLPWGHVSSGCIYSGSRSDGSGFNEDDVPNFSFRTNNCSFYSGTKALGEECLTAYSNVYIWRLRIPFNHLDGPRNYLSKLQRYECLLDATNSISHLNEFVSACWQTWQQRIPFGTYNVTNSGWVTTREVVSLIQKHLNLNKHFRYFSSENEFMSRAALTPRSNCIMDNSKILSAGVQLSHVTDALEKSLRGWRS